MSSVEMSDVKSLQALVRKRAGFLRGLVGLAADFRCGVCFKLASDHVGGVITDCCDKEMPEDQLLASLQSQLSSIDGLVSRLDMLSVQSGQVTRLTAEADEYRSIVDEKDALLQAKEAELAASQERVVECNAELASRDDEIAGLRSEKLVWRSEKDSLTESVCEGVCSIWRSYLGGASAESVVGRLRSEFDYTVPLSSFPTSPASLNTPTSAADTSPSAASASNSPASSLPASTNPASSSSASTDADGDKVGKSTKSIKVEFKVDDSAMNHLKKEQSILNEIDLLFPGVNAATKIAMVVSHCDQHVKSIAITTRASAKVPFNTVDEFLAAFRDERYPSFFNDCRIALQSMKQNQKESVYQFYWRYLYLLKAMGRDPEHYHDDFLKKLLHPQVVTHVRFLPRAGRTLQGLANHCDEIEKELGCRKVKQQSDNDESVSAVSSGRGGGSQRGRGGGRGRGRGRGRGGSKAVATALSRVDTWGIKESGCWHCFKDHPREEQRACSDKLPCLFCGVSGHRSAFCSSAPATKEEFQAALQKSR